MIVPSRCHPELAGAIVGSFDVVDGEKPHSLAPAWPARSPPTAPLHLPRVGLHAGVPTKAASAETFNILKGSIGRRKGARVSTELPGRWIPG